MTTLVATAKPQHRTLFTALLFTSAMLSSISGAHADTYLLEPNHSNVRFAIDHFNTSTNTGGFYNITGQLRYNPRAQTGDISLVMPIHSLNTGNTAFDIVLKSPDFFDVERFPLASFTSTKWHFDTATDTSKVTQVDGNLTLHGETHPVTLTATKLNCYFSPIVKKSVCGGDFTTTIDRRQWGISKYTLLGITENVALTIQVEAVKQ